VTLSGTSFSDLQAVVQAWQPMQRDWSSTLIHLIEAAAWSVAEGVAVGYKLR